VSRKLTEIQASLHEAAERRARRRDRGEAAYQLRKQLAENGEQLSSFVRRHEDSELDAARALGLRPEAYVDPLLGCPWCAGLSHRRPLIGCKGCGEPYQAERIAPPEPQGFSSIFGFATW
jgi:hypothetical protein